MAVEAPTRPTPETTSAGLSIDTGIHILEQARYALPWNSPDAALAAQLKNQARVDRLQIQAKIGSTGENAETRHILAKANENVVRTRRLGLASGSYEDGATGMVFAVATNRTQPEGQPTSIGDRDTTYELYYMSHHAIEEALESSYKDQAAQPKIDPYVYRAALGFIATQDKPQTQPEDRIYRVDLDSIANSSFIRVARDMRNNGQHGRIPSRIDTINQRIIASGRLPNPNNISNFTSHQTQEEQKRTAQSA